MQPIKTVRKSKLNKTKQLLNTVSMYITFKGDWSKHRIQRIKRYA